MVHSVSQSKKYMVAELRMLKWMCDHTRLDMIKNEIIKDKVRVAPIRR